MNIYDKIVGDKIKEYRLNRKMTLRQTASVFGVSKSSIFAYENGTRGMPVEMLIKMLKYYDVDANQFINECLKDVE